MFAYCGNNPVNDNDPTGEFAVAATFTGIAFLENRCCIVGFGRGSDTDNNDRPNPSVLPSVSLPKIESKSDTKEKILYRLFLKIRQGKILLFIVMVELTPEI